jgi:predicted CopG family antitoxin
MPQISVIDECYEQLDAMKKELSEQKKAKGQPTKTTFSEVVCMLIRERKGIV